MHLLNISIYIKIDIKLLINLKMVPIYYYYYSTLILLNIDVF
jgi:hypothetical protein